MLKKSSLLLLFAIICACVLAHDGHLTLNAIGYNPQRPFDPIIQPNSPNGNNTNNNNSTIMDDVMTLNNLQSRDELLNNISSYNDLHEILVKYRNFIEISANSANINNNASISKVTTIPSRSIVIYYLENIENFDNTKYSILMFKFTNALGEQAIRRVDYNITINNGTTTPVKENGSTFTGTDLKIIRLPIDQDIQLNVTRFNNKMVSEHVILSQTAIQSPDP